MIWNDHSKQVPEGAHAFLGASKYSWLNYTDDKLIETYTNLLAKEKGTELHAIACSLIKNGIELKSSRKTLNIHDLKTGKKPALLHQLEIYASLFCLEYNIKPGDLSGIELRIYQNNDILYGYPEADDILPIMDKIVTFDKILTKIEEDEDEWTW